MHMGEGTLEAFEKETVFELLCAKNLHFWKDKAQPLEGVSDRTKTGSELGGRDS